MLKIIFGGKLCFSNTAHKLSKESGYLIFIEAYISPQAALKGQ
jgi:hypothetical protein